MSEPKPLASLSAGLLARKGGARPAMRRQAQLPGPNGSFSGHEDLGWNDMGYDVDPSDSAHDIGRAASQGLSPMGAAIGDTAEARAMLNDAVDRAMIEPVAIGSVNGSPVKGSALNGGPLNGAVHGPAGAERPEVLRQREHIERALAPMPRAAQQPAIIATQPATRAPRMPRAQAGARGNFAFTLRLDPERHLRLRLASATRNRSVQQILIGLIDAYLADCPEIDAFAANLPTRSN